VGHVVDEHGDAIENATITRIDVNDIGYHRSRENGCVVRAWTTAPHKTATVLRVDADGFEAAELRVDKAGTSYFRIVLAAEGAGRASVAMEVPAGELAFCEFSD